MEQWRKFHCDMKDLGSWLAEAETKLHETRNANGDLILSVARTVQKVSFSLVFQVKEMKPFEIFS